MTQSKEQRPGQTSTPSATQGQEESTFGQAREAVEQVASTVQDSTQQAMHQVSQFDLKRYAQDNPWMVIGAGLATGYFLSTLFQGEQSQYGRSYNTSWQSDQSYGGYGQHIQANAMQQARQYESTQRQGMVGKLGRTFFSSLSSLDVLFQEKLEGIYDAEHQILKALPKMIQTASSQELKQAFERHLQQTQGQIRRLEQVLNMIGAPSRGKTCTAMQGILAEGEELMSRRADPAVMDAGLIACAQVVEHYEIAIYGSLRTWAEQLGNQQATSLLQQSLREEEQTDRQLSQLAEHMVNLQAAR